MRYCTSRIITEGVARTASGRSSTITLAEMIMRSTTHLSSPFWTRSYPCSCGVGFSFQRMDCHRKRLKLPERFIASHCAIFASSHGINLHAMIHPETARGKGLVDAHFSIATQHIHQIVRDPCLYVCTSADLWRAFHHGGGIRGLS